MQFRNWITFRIILCVCYVNASCICNMDDVMELPKLLRKDRFNKWCFCRRVKNYLKLICSLHRHFLSKSIFSKSSQGRCWCWLNSRTFLLWPGIPRRINQCIQMMAPSSQMPNIHRVCCRWSFNCSFRLTRLEEFSTPFTPNYIDSWPQVGITSVAITIFNSYRIAHHIHLFPMFTNTPIV